MDLPKFEELKTPEDYQRFEQLLNDRNRETRKMCETLEEQIKQLMMNAKLLKSKVLELSTRESQNN